MLEVSADVALGEAIEPSVEAIARVNTVRWPATVYPGVGMGVGLVAGSLVAFAIAAAFRRTDGYEQLLWLFGAMVGLSLGLRAAARRHLRDFLAGLRRLGSPAIFPTRFRVTDAGLEVASERLAYRIAWPAVLFLLPSRDHWLLQADSLTIVIPRRAFPDTASEQAFIAAIRDRLSPAARERSPA